MTNKQIARALRETGEFIELTGGNTFRARAYHNAARVIERLEEPAADLAEAGGLAKIGGLGAGIAAQVAELAATGSFDLREELINSIPPGLVDMLRVKGIGAKKARTIWKQLAITSVEELEGAAEVGRLAALPGFGKRTQETVLANVRQFQRYRTHRRYAEATQTAAPIVAALADRTDVVEAALTGDLRRAQETVSSIEILASSRDVEATASAVSADLSYHETARTEDHVTLSRTTEDGIPVRVHVTSVARFPLVLWRTTGSAAHCEAFARQFGATTDAEAEALIYRAAGLPFIPPELREDLGELEAARDDKLPELIRLSDVQGALHTHSTYSDGAHTLREMADACRARGLSYLGICDHSRSLTIANGLSEERVAAQQAEIRMLNAAYAADGGPAFRIFSGIESDILQDGSLDYSDEVLASFDFIVASVHSRFNMSEREATARLVEAVRNPYTTILGHATGRLLLTRSGYPIDHEAVIAACGASGTVIELNANPRRLDMDWRWLRTATEAGVPIAINPDAHSIDELDYLSWGVAAARKGWLTRDQCLNAMSLAQITAWFETRRAAHTEASS